MPSYRFAMQNDGTQTEELGGMSMRDDGDALAFAERIARDLADDSHPGLAIAIFEGARAVGSIRVEPAPAA